MGQEEGTVCMRGNVQCSAVQCSAVQCSAVEWENGVRYVDQLHQFKLKCMHWTRLDGQEELSYHCCPVM